jgi:hypothetical protein
VSVATRNGSEKLLLVGDNPFLGVSHLSQERARARGRHVTSAPHAGELLIAALENGANGFLFSVSEITLSILDTWKKSEPARRIELYAIAPYAYEYVRAAVGLGGIPGLVKEVSGRVIRSRDVRAVTWGLSGIARNDPTALLKGYLSYEAARVRLAAGEAANFNSLLLHELVTDMALGLEMDWLFRAHVDFNRREGIRPGFNTRNLPYLVRKFHEWGISLEGAVIAAPFNAVGFQMCPSKEECERILAELKRTEVIAFSILAAGHLNYSDAVEYVTKLPNLSGVAIGVSKMEQARSTFKRLRESYASVAA